MKKIMIFSHNDLDGYGSPYILERMAKISNQERYPEDKVFDKRYCNTGNYGDINEKINKFIDSKQIFYYDEVFLTDLTPSLETLTKLVETCKEKNIYLKVYDHHASETYMNEMFPEIVSIIPEINSVKTSGTSLIFDMFYKNISDSIKDEKKVELIYLENLAQIIRSYDTWDWSNDPNDTYKENANNFNKLFTYNFKPDWVKRVSEVWSIWPTETEKLILEVINKEESKYVYRKSLSNNLTFGEVVYEGASISYVLTYADLYKNALATKLINSYPNIQMVFILDKDILSIRSDKEDINVGEIAKSLFDGGGHPAAGGGKIVGLTELIKNTIEQK